MGRWYKNSDICVAYLEDVSGNPKEDVLGELEWSEWFERGWTLQELLLPQKVIFCTRLWNEIGYKKDGPILNRVEKRTKIGRKILQFPHAIRDRCIAQKISWASCRTTTREEDMAYCLLGLFDVNMPLLYGEGGGNAFIRLQLELISRFMDDSIFAWNASGYLSGEPGREGAPGSALAWKPSLFSGCEKIVGIDTESDRINRPPYYITNKGLAFTGPSRHIKVPRDDIFKDVESRKRLQSMTYEEAHSGEDLYLIPLNCQDSSSANDPKCVSVFWALTGDDLLVKISGDIYGSTVDDFEPWWSRDEEVEKQFYFFLDRQLA